ncbi:hypothetical protein [Baekduia sp. Peel2402]|uniref:hypothetical protein n=1 Tax=Baekduia sp. Peel2402 TaxID=3458296 RepID=UPI00403E7DE1
MALGARSSRRLIAVVPPLLVALLALPFVVGQNAWWEWANPYWFLGRQAAHVSATGFPTLFLQLETGTFNPYFVYYAGPLLSVLAYPAALFGAWPVFIGATVGAMVGGYFGVWWAACTLGLSRTTAVLPGLAFASTPFLISTLYDRGAWAELVAANAAAVLFAGVLAVVFRRPGARDTGGLIAILGASAVVAGTHNITLMVSAILLPLLLLALLPLRPADAVPLGGALARAVAAAALGIGLTAAWLLPNLWYGRDTLIAQPELNDTTLADFSGGTGATSQLTPWPHVPAAIADGDRHIHPQLPVLVLLWAIGVFAVLVARRRPVPGRVLAAVAGLAVLGVAIIVLVANPSWWLHFPPQARIVQFPFRLLTYAALIVALGAAVTMRALGGGAVGRRAVAVLGAAVAVQLAFGAYVALDGQAASPLGDVKPPRKADARAEDVPPAFASAALLTPAQFRVHYRPTADASSAAASIGIDDPLTSDVATIGGDQPAGTLVQVQVAWSPYAKVTGGASLAGRDAVGMAIVRVEATGPDGRWAAKVSPTTPGPLAVGRIISALSLLVVVALAATALRGRRRRQRSVTPAPDSAAPEPIAALVK